jgi:hypothetical protein
MALKYVCDGCEIISNDREDFAERGPLARIYCADCAEIVDDYAGKRDKLHDRVAKTWNNGLAKLRKEYDGKVKLLDDAKVDNF